MIASDVIDDARTMLRDTQIGGFRWSEEDFLQYLSDSQREVRDVRPDAFLSGSTMDEPVNVSGLNSTLKLEEPYRRILSLLVASRAIGEDTDDRANQDLSTKYRKNALDALRGAG